MVEEVNRSSGSIPKIDQANSGSIESPGLPPAAATVPTEGASSPQEEGDRGALARLQGPSQVPWGTTGVASLFGQALGALQNEVTDSFFSELDGDISYLQPDKNALVALEYIEGQINQTGQFPDPLADQVLSYLG